MAPTLSEIRARLAKQAASTGNSTTDNAVYPFWNLAETPPKNTATIRFLPDGSADAEYFWQERQVIRLPFSGIKGVDEHKETFVTIPCMKMWGENDYVLTQTKKWWDDPELKDEARKYWIKRSYVFQGFVVDNQIADDRDNAPENPIRRFIINSTIFKIIKDSIMNPELEELPTHYERGRDFKITKSKSGQWADYGTSSWSFKERALSVPELEAIEKYGLFNLRDYLPTKPTEGQLKAIQEMFESSVNGEPYDVKKWGEFYRPAGMARDGDGGNDEVSGGGSSSSAGTSSALARLKARSVAAPQETPAKAAPVTPAPEQDDEPPFETSSDTQKGTKDANAILDMLRKKAQAQ